MAHRRGLTIACVLSCLVLFLAFCPHHALSAVHHTPWTHDTFPNPSSHPTECKREKASRVCNPDGVLSKVAADKLDTLSWQLEEEHKFPDVCCEGRGPQLAFAIMARMSIAPHEGKEEVARHMAEQIGNAWGVGRKQCDNGVLFLFARDDRYLHVATGRGVKHALTDSMLDTLIEEARPRLRAGEYDEAVLEMAAQIYLVLSGDSSHFAWSFWGMVAALLDSGTSILFVIVLIGSICACIGNYRKTSEYRQCKLKLSMIERERALALSKGFKARSCAICLEEWGEQETEIQGEGVVEQSAEEEEKADENQTERKEKEKEKHEGGRKRVGEKETKEEGHGDMESGERKSKKEGEGDDVDDSEKEDEDEASRRPKPKVRTMVLRCGHKFCKTCITAWLAQHHTCPICRQNPSSATAKPPSPRVYRPDSSTSNYCSTRPLHMYHYDYSTELAFRLAMLQRQYPSYITESMITRWTDPTYTGSFSADAMFRAARPQNPQWSSGGGGGSGFGGGSFGGGGGRGGGW